MMWENERQQFIIDILEKERFASVSYICSNSKVSPATIRRDINKMSKKGLIKKIRGGAEAIAKPGFNPKKVNNFYPTENRQDAGDQTNIKLIAKTAAALCVDNESVIINGGLITNVMSEYLIDKQLTIKTNSLVVAQSLWGRSNNQITLPAGEIYGAYGLIVGDFQNNTDSSPAHYYSKMFISTKAISKIGVMEADKFIATAEFKLKSQAKQLIVLAESSSLGMTSNFICSSLSEVNVLITDSNAEQAMLEEFAAYGIEVIIAD